MSGDINIVSEAVARSLGYRELKTRATDRYQHSSIIVNQRLCNSAKDVSRESIVIIIIIIINFTG